MNRPDADTALRMFMDRLEAAAENDPTATAHDPLADSRVGWREARPDEPAIRVSTIRRVMAELRKDVREAPILQVPAAEVIAASTLRVVIDDLEETRVRNTTPGALRDELVRRYTLWRSRALKNKEWPPSRRPGDG